MARTPPFTLAYDPETKEHLHVIEAKNHSLIRATIEEQLSFEPETETRNRKPLKRPTEWAATWELRLGPKNRFRVLYAVDQETRIVRIQAIGVKQGNRLLVGNREVNL